MTKTLEYIGRRIMNLRKINKVNFNEGLIIDYQFICLRINELSLLKTRLNGKGVEYYEK